MKMLLFGEVILELGDLQFIIKKGACDIEIRIKGTSVSKTFDTRELRDAAFTKLATKLCGVEAY